MRSLDAIAEVNEAVASVNVFTGSDESELTPIPDGTFQPDIIVLLTDGASNRGALPLAAAQAAVDGGVRVYTIGFGTSEGLPFNCTEQQLGGIQFEGGFGGEFGGVGFGSGDGGFGGGGFSSGGGHFRFGLDEDTLQQVAEITDAEYYLAESAGELLDVFTNVPTYLDTTKVTTEISVVFAAIGALLAFVAVVLMQLWNPLP